VYGKLPGRGYWASNCDGNRLNAIAPGLAIGALRGFAGGTMGGLGSWISKSRGDSRRYLIGLAAGLTRAGAIALIIMGFGPRSVAKWF
jgi:hypothetical protein